MKNLKSAVIGVLAGFWLLTAAHASEMKISGSARVRSEFRRNDDFASPVGDTKASIGSRFRLGFSFEPREDLGVFIQPQFSKTWGLVDAAGAATSGAANDTELDAHQAYIRVTPWENVDFTIGRQELTYGDELVIGKLDWSNVGRSFDAVRARFGRGSGWADVFGAKLTESNAAAGGVGDKDLVGVYSSWDLGEWAREADLYVLYMSDETGVADPNLAAGGLRLKSKPSDFDYRAEITVEDGIEYQGDFEWGYEFSSERKLRLAVEYFRASADYNQLFPTAHKWLGIADFFSRRNISGFRLGGSADLGGGFGLLADGHYSLRTDTARPAFRYSGAPYGSAGTAAPIASELDLILSYKANDNLGLALGGSVVLPGIYLKDNHGPDSGAFLYAQMLATF